MVDDEELLERIRAKAYALWQDEGRPAGREMHHWDKARILVSIEDDRTSLMPVAPARPEEAALQTKLGEFPTAMTDEGDGQQTPSRQTDPKIVGESAASAKPRKPKKR